MFEGCDKKTITLQKDLKYENYVRRPIEPDISSRGEILTGNSR